MSDALRVDASIPAALARSQPAPLAVTVTNVSDADVLVNRRLAPGYRDSTSREVWAELVDEHGEPAAVATIDYERDLPTADDYVPLGPGESIAGEFDLFHYARPQRPGRYAITAYYQADEPVAGPPTGAVAGEYASDSIVVEVA